MNKTVWFVLFALFAGLLATSAVVYPRSSNTLQRVKLPDGGICPRVASENDRLHVVYGRKNGVYYVHSTDGGSSFSVPVSVGGSHASAVVGHERGPRIALGRAGSVHVVWMGTDNTRVFYSHSTDGQHFSEPRNLAPRTAGVDGPTVAADRNGNIYVAWIQAGEGRESPVSKTLMLASSTDDGISFSPATPVQSDYPGGACACCAIAATVGPSGQLFIGFRGAYRNIRDIYLLESTAKPNRFEAVRVSDDHWVIEMCPMAGPSLQALPTGRMLVAWMSQGQVYRSVSSSEGQNFAARIAPAGDTGNTRTLPLIVSGGSGEQLFVWLEGEKICWERISAEGRVVDSGENGGLPANSEPAAYFNRDGSFVLLY